MYKVASDRRQTTLHRGRPSDWVNGEEVLTAERRLEQMKEGARILEARILASANSDPERTRLGQEKFKLQNEIKMLKAQLNIVKIARRSLGDVFVDMAKEILPKVQYEMVRNAALREHDRQQKALDQVALPSTMGTQS